MEKQTIRVEVDYQFDWSYGVSISKIREDLDKMEALGVTEIELTPEQFYESVSLMQTGIIERMETDEEVEARINTVKKREAARRKVELAQLKALKAKYESLGGEKMFQESDKTIIVDK